MALGHHLAAELGFADSCDTLGKWMSHHLVEVMDRAESEENLKKRVEYQHQAVGLILKIWEYRGSLEGDAYPLARFKGVINALSILSPEANVWERNRLGKYESLAADTFSMIVDLYRSLHFVDFFELQSVRNKKFPPELLADDEQEMYDMLISWAIEELEFRSSNESSEVDTEVKLITDNLCDFIDKLCEKLHGLKDELRRPEEIKRGL